MDLVQTALCLVFACLHSVYAPVKLTNPKTPAINIGYLLLKAKGKYVFQVKSINLLLYQKFISWNTCLIVFTVSHNNNNNLKISSYKKYIYEWLCFFCSEKSPKYRYEKL